MLYHLALPFFSTLFYMTCDGLRNFSGLLTPMLVNKSCVDGCRSTLGCLSTGNSLVETFRWYLRSITTSFFSYFMHVLLSDFLGITSVDFSSRKRNLANA